MLKEQQEEYAFRVYVSDILSVIAQSIGAEVYTSYVELINPEKVDRRTGDEIALDIIKRAELKVKNEQSIRTNGQDWA